MGDWYGALATMVPDREVRTTWFDYLAQYSVFHDRLQDRTTRLILSEMPISRFALCRNDAHLSNFVLAADGRLVGFDFEAAALKPHGWDILLAARDLGRRFPQYIPELTTALVEGWGGGCDEVSARRFLWLARLFSETTLSADHSSKGRAAGHVARPTI